MGETLRNDLRAEKPPSATVVKVRDYCPTDPWTPLAFMHRGVPTIIGPHTSSMRLLAGQPVTMSELVTDLSPFGHWNEVDANPLKWADQVRDHVGGDW
jgi:hypothetical protein